MAELLETGSAVEVWERYASPPALIDLPAARLSATGADSPLPAPGRM
jgi:hypothetical protein